MKSPEPFEFDSLEIFLVDIYLAGISRELDKTILLAQFFLFAHPLSVIVMPRRPR